MNGWYKDGYDNDIKVCAWLKSLMAYACRCSWVIIHCFVVVVDDDVVL